MKNLHTHCTWCDGANTPEEMILAAIEAGYSTLGFSSHAMLPGDPLPWPLTKEKIVPYAAEIRSLAKKYAGKIEVKCGVEADYVEGVSSPDRSVYECISPDYIIGSVHFVPGPNGGLANVDKSPSSLIEDIENIFAGDVKAYLKAYFAAQRKMALELDFDIIGHPDLCRKFNSRLGYFDESAPWYLEELRLCADAFAQSGKIVEINTGGITRGWMDEAYPSPCFRALLKERNVPMIQSLDAHDVQTIRNPVWKSID